MKNRYEVRGGAISIVVRCKGRNLETFISAADLPKADGFLNSWYAYWCRKSRTYYVMGNNPRCNGRQAKTTLHRFLSDAGPDKRVDHIDHDGLNNRRDNLRLVTPSQNSQNRRGPNKNNKTSGVRGVTWLRKRGVWQAQMGIDGKKRWIGYFASVSEAEDAVVAARSAHMPFSRENKGTRDGVAL